MNDPPILKLSTQLVVVLIDILLSTDESNSLVYVDFLIFVLSPQKYQTAPQDKIFKILDKEVREEAENRSTIMVIMAIYYIRASYTDHGNSKLPILQRHESYGIMVRKLFIKILNFKIM